jgi:aspartyl-tRNA(Asn)/glutamyl-tRNA(Gln) amidotransferase subunit B
MEVHAQVVSRAKLFSSSPVMNDGEANSNVSLVDVAAPGMLPVLNRYCVEQAILTGLALNAKINPYCSFDRKNYFYPDSPQGYQITQHFNPIISGGSVVITTKNGVEKIVRISQIHLEQDAGKLIHTGAKTHIDLNRVGVALMEIVSYPDLSSSEEAGLYLKKLRTILRYIGTCDGDMEKGNLRADVNVSVRRVGAPLGTRCEIKNVNSVRYAQQAIEYESRRQIALLEEGELVVQETRLFDAAMGVTRAMRSKEDAHDYRYFPCPDLPALRIGADVIEDIRSTRLIELPDQKTKRLVESYGVTVYDADVLAAEKESADFFEDVVAYVQGISPDISGKNVANWVINELFGRLNKEKMSIKQSPVSIEQLGKIIALSSGDAISGKSAKEILEIVWNDGGDPDLIVEEKGMKQISDMALIKDVCEKIIQMNPDKKELAQKKPNLIGWFVGQVLKETQGKANPQIVHEIIEKLISHE